MRKNITASTKWYMSGVVASEPVPYTKFILHIVIRKERQTTAGVASLCSRGTNYLLKTPTKGI